MPSPISFTSLPAVVQGASLSVLLQGVNRDGSDPTVDAPSGLLASDALTCTVSLGQGLPSIIAPAVTWVNADLCRVALSIVDAESAQLAVDGDYLLEIFAGRGANRYPIVVGYLPVLPSADGQASSAPPDLISVPYAGRMLGMLGLTAAQLEQVPTLIAAASGAVRSYCNRLFTQTTVIETLAVELDGSIMLSQIPIATVRRIQARPSVALTIANNIATSSWVSQATTGDPIAGLTTTGLVLNWVASGLTYSATFPYAAGLTIAGLAAQVNAGSWSGATIVGTPTGSPPYGWSATADDTLGAWPVAELFDAVTARGAGPNDRPYGGAQLSVFSQDLGMGYPDPDMGQLTGHWYVGRQGWGVGRAGGGWGWGWSGGGWGDGIAGANRGAGTGYVKVQYVGGFASVPADIQRAVVEIVHVELDRLKTDFMLKSESGGQYSYVLNDTVLDAFPPFVRNALNSYRITNA